MAKKFRFNFTRYIDARKKLKMPTRSRCIKCGRLTPRGAFMCISCINKAKRRKAKRKV